MCIFKGYHVGNWSPRKLAATGSCNRFFHFWRGCNRNRKIGPNWSSSVQFWSIFRLHGLDLHTLFLSSTKVSRLSFIEVFIMSVLSIFGVMSQPKLALHGQIHSQILNYTTDSILITKIIYGFCISFSFPFSTLSLNYLHRGGIARAVKSGLVQFFRYFLMDRELDRS